MSDAVKQLLPVIDAMTPDEQIELMGCLAEMDGNDLTVTAAEWERRWGSVIDRRVAAFNLGRFAGTHAEAVFRRLEAKLTVVRGTLPAPTALPDGSVR